MASHLRRIWLQAVDYDPEGTPGTVTETIPEEFDFGKVVAVEWYRSGAFVTFCVAGPPP